MWFASDGTKRFEDRNGAGENGGMKTLEKFWITSN
jgi:hypothetical protein